MFKLIYSKEGFCTRCGRYKYLNMFKICMSCYTYEKLMKKAKDLKPVRRKRSGFGLRNGSIG